MANGRLTARYNRPEVQHKLAVLHRAAQQVGLISLAWLLMCLLPAVLGEFCVRPSPSGF